MRSTRRRSCLKNKRRKRSMRKKRRKSCLKSKRKQRSMRNMRSKNSSKNKRRRSMKSLRRRNCSKNKRRRSMKSLKRKNCSRNKRRRSSKSMRRRKSTMRRASINHMKVITPTTNTNTRSIRNTRDQVPIIPPTPQTLISIRTRRFNHQSMHIKSIMTDYLTTRS